MGQFSDMLNQLMQIESQGFNPYTDSYSSRIGKLQVSTPTAGSDVVDGNTSNGKTSVIDNYAASGFEDPRKTLYSETGDLDRSKISTPYNDLLRDPTLGDPNKYIEEINTLLPPEEQIFINPDKSLGFGKNMKPAESKIETNINYGKYWDNQKKSYVYKRENEKTGEVYETYDDPKKFKEEAKLYRESKQNAVSK